MAIILNIDTSSERAVICISRQGEIVSKAVHDNQRDHAGFLHVALQEILNESGISLQQLDAVNVCDGPGSYTGLRVGMSTAKGLCYALQKPLLTTSALQMIAQTALDFIDQEQKNDTNCFIPMIDARRMEVFYAVYDNTTTLRHEPGAIILNEGSFTEFMNHGKVVFCGSGAAKWKRLCSHKNALFAEVLHCEEQLCKIAESKCQQGIYTNLTDGLPHYVKEFHDTVKTS